MSETKGVSAYQRMVNECLARSNSLDLLVSETITVSLSLFVEHGDVMPIHIAMTMVLDIYGQSIHDYLAGAIPVAVPALRWNKRTGTFVPRRGVERKVMHELTSLFTKGANHDVVS